MIERRYLTIKDLAEYLSISSQTIRNKLSLGTFPIPAKRIGGSIRFDRKVVEATMEKLPEIGPLKL
jgi:excisionase family DNA binding protein